MAGAAEDGGILKTVVIAAALGAITGGLGFYVMPMLGMELAAGATFLSMAASGAIMGGIDGGVTGSIGMLVEAWA